MRFFVCIIGDVLILRYPDSAPEFLHHLPAIFAELAQRWDVPDSPWNFLVLVLDANLQYQGVLPVSGELGPSNTHQPYQVHQFNESDLRRAIEKLKLAYDLGPGTNPLL